MRNVVEAEGDLETSGPNTEQHSSLIVDLYRCHILDRAAGRHTSSSVPVLAISGIKLSDISISLAF